MFKVFVILHTQLWGSWALTVDFTLWVSWYVYPENTLWALLTEFDHESEPLRT